MTRKTAKTSSRSAALIAAQERYEEKRNTRKTLLRLSEEEAAVVDGEAEPDETREATVKRIIRSWGKRRRR